MTLVPTEGKPLARLRYKQLISSDPTAPLVLLVHGRAGNFDVMWAFKRVLPDACNIVAVQAPITDEGGFSWWQIGKDKEIMKAAAKKAAGELEVFLKEFNRQNSLSPRRTIAIGFSQGGALLSVAVQLGMQLDGVAFLASFTIPLDRQNLSPTTEIFIAHGARDEIVKLSVSERARDFFLEQGLSVSFIVDDVGHKVGVEGMKALKIWAQKILCAQL